MNDTIISLSACEIADLVKKRELSAREVCEDYLARADADDTNAYITKTSETALAQADKTDELIKAGEGERLSLAGVPVSVKDNICTKGIKTTCASAMLADFVPSYSASAYERLIKAGAVLIGKTNLDEFAVGSDGTTSYFGKSINPLDHTRTAGGSSSGAAASLAGNSALLALGSDTGGSARLPAAFCGVCAMKSTYGAVSRAGLVGLAPSLEQICPMSRDTRDNKLLFDAVRGEDPLDMTTNGVPICEFVTKDNLRVGVYLPNGAKGYVKDAVLETARKLEGFGAFCEEISLPFEDEIIRTYYTICAAEASSNLARFDGIRYGGSLSGRGVSDIRTQSFGPKLKERIAEGVYVLEQDGGAPYARALEVRKALVENFDDITSRFDVILSPVCDTVAHAFSSEKFMGDRFTVYANLAGVPAYAMPSGVKHDALPVGIQLMAGRGRENLIYGIALLLEGGEVL